jgi:hypothetical protein
MPPAAGFADEKPEGELDLPPVYSHPLPANHPCKDEQDKYLLSLKALAASLISWGISCTNFVNWRSCVNATISLNTALDAAKAAADAYRDCLGTNPPNMPLVPTLQPGQSPPTVLPEPQPTGPFTPFTHPCSQQLDTMPVPGSDVVSCALSCERQMEGNARLCDSCSSVRGIDPQMCRVYASQKFQDCVNTCQLRTPNTLASELR